MVAVQTGVPGKKVAGPAALLLALALIGSPFGSAGAKTTKTTKPSKAGKTAKPVKPTRTTTTLRRLTGPASSGSAGTASTGSGTTGSVMRSVNVPTGDLTEASGCAVVVNDPGTVWLHNDSGNSPVLFAFDLATSKIRSVPVANASVVDWEDSAPLPGGGLVIGDIGDNDSKRESVQLYRIDDLTKSPLNATRRDLRYEDGPHNAEALVVDPASPVSDPAIYVITKEPTGRSSVYQAIGTTLKKVASVSILDEALLFPNLITGGAALPGGAGVILRTYQYVYVYKKPAGQPFTAAFSVKPTRVSTPFLLQTEAVCVLSNGTTALTTTESRGASTIPFVFFPIP